MDTEQLVDEREHYLFFDVPSIFSVYSVGFTTSSCAFFTTTKEGFGWLLISVFNPDVLFVEGSEKITVSFIA